MAGTLSEFSEALAGVVAEAGRGTVRVDARRRVGASGIVWSPDGLVVTAHHVIERDDSIRIGLPDGRAVPTTVVGRDPSTDLAVLKAQAQGLTPPAWAEPDTLRAGHLVLALGRPGQTIRTTLGVVSALGESWVTPTGGRVDRYLQTDAALYPGFSGGPLVDASARVVGLTTSALLRGVSVALPLPTVRRVVEALVAHGRVSRGYLGVSTQPVRLPAAQAGQTEQETALLVVAVAPDSPAERSGLLVGDIIVVAGDQPVRFVDDLLAALSGAQVGTALALRVIRGGQARDLTVAVGEHP